MASLEIADQAEKLAFQNKVLPSLGFTDTSDATGERRFVPFDLIGTSRGEGVLIDVTTRITECGRSRRTAFRLASALMMMRLLALLVKPGVCAFALRDSTESFHTSIKELIPLP